MIVVIVFTWTENYGDVSVAPSQAFRKALETVKNGTVDLLFIYFQNCYHECLIIDCIVEFINPDIYKTAYPIFSVLNTEY